MSEPDSPFALPPPRALQAALDRTTETLARELANPTRARPDWSELDWRIARAVAAMHGVSPLLSRALLWRGPESWTAFLEDQRVQTAARHSRIQTMLQEVDAHARHEEIALVALKGAELHAAGLYSPGERPMADVDLLVRPAAANQAARMLVSLGFEESLATRRHRSFYQPGTSRPGGLGEHADNYLKVELHEHIRESLPVKSIDVTKHVFPSNAAPGLNRYASKAALMTHLVLHAAGAVSQRAIRLLHLNDLALLSRQMSQSDWDQFLLHDGTDPGRWWALPPLQLTANYYVRAIPDRVLTCLSDQCPPILLRSVRRRTLSHLSLSALRVEAFPAIGWSRSATEAARYVFARLRPGTEMLAQRKQLAQTHIAALDSQWNRLSQGGRMLRWVTTRPARIDTMHAVRMALTPPQQSVK